MQMTKKGPNPIEMVAYLGVALGATFAAAEVGNHYTTPAAMEARMAAWNPNPPQQIKTAAGPANYNFK